MRAKMIVSALSVIFAALILVPVASHAAWPTTAATRCWTIAPGIFMKAQITPVGGGFYSVHSMFVENSTIQNIGTGTAYIRGNLVYLVSADAGAGVGSAAMATGQGWTVLNKTTLVGTVEGIGHDKNYSDGSLDTEYNSGPITLKPVSCSAIWR